ncbi:MAG: CDP-alcohol phosphatidyltransferase family protein, partial [Bacteroidota bacterium]
MKDRVKKHLPNFLTCLNLLCGCLAVIAAFQEDVNPFDTNPTPMGLHPAGLIWASFFVGIAAVLDFLDGMAARFLNAYSEMGKQLDSLADMVSFGVVPGIIMFH